MADKTSIGLDSSTLRERLRPLRSEKQAVRYAGKLVEQESLTTPGVWADMYQTSVSATEQLAETELPEPVEATSEPATPIVRKLDFTAPALDKPKKTKAKPSFSVLGRLRMPSINKSNIASRLTIVLAVGLLLFGFAVTAHTLMLNNRLQNKVSAAPYEQSAEGEATPAAEQPQGGPDETKPNLASYSVPADQPKFVRIPKFNTTARIKAMGVDANNKLIAPGNVHDAGWFQNSAKPGAIGGATLLDGHVSGWTTKGVFYRLKELVPGDQITIERGDGQIFTYRVVKSQAFDKNAVDMDSVMRSVNASKTGLNLITCSGSYDRASDDYTQRLVVYAEAI